MATVPEIVLPGVTFDGIPIEPLDPMLSLGGVLALYDVTHPEMTKVTGMWADGASFFNVAHESAAAILGAGDATTLAGTFANTGHTSADGAFERTPKGGIHYASKTAGQTVGHYKAITLATLLVDYFNSHDMNDTYLGLWGRTTRPGGGTIPHSYVRLAQNGSIIKNAIQENPTTNPASLAGQPATPALLRGRRNMNVPDTKISHLNHGYGAVTMASVVSNLIYFGALGSGDVNFSPSWVFYRLVLADMSVSGRTYAEYDALDHDMFVLECETEGGRFYGDTFTAPSVLAA